MSINSFVRDDQKINKNLQIRRFIAVNCLDRLQEKLNELGLKVEKRNLIQPAVAAYSRYKEAGQIEPYERKVNNDSGSAKDVRDIATTPELPEETLVILYSLAISEIGAERAIDDGSASQDIWKHAIEVGLTIINDLFDEKYASSPSQFFDALKNMGSEAKKVKL